MVRLKLSLELVYEIFGAPGEVQEVPVARLPSEVLGYVYPSRYCQSDRLGRLAIREFGQLRQGYGRVQAIRDWVNQRVAFTSNSSNATTSAIDTLIEQAGVCRWVSCASAPGAMRPMSPSQRSSAQCRRRRRFGQGAGATTT